MTSVKQTATRTQHNGRCKTKQRARQHGQHICKVFTFSYCASSI